jgi:hypothetical protein
MASHTITITISTKAYDLLKNHKTGRESFSEVILRKMPPPPALTAGELLDWHEKFAGKEIIDEDLMREVERGRKRGRSKRSLKNAA